MGFCVEKIKASTFLSKLNIILIEIRATKLVFF